MKFDKVIKETFLQLEADPGMDPNLGGAPTGPGGPGGAPTPDIPGVGEPTGPSEPPPKPEVKPLTTEGKRYLVELALKALQFDPSHLTASDVSLFDQPVTTENAEEILDQINSILSGTDVPSSGDETT